MFKINSVECDSIAKTFYYWCNMQADCVLSGDELRFVVKKNLLHKEVYLARKYYMNEFG